MNTKFFNRAVGHANILVGDNIDQLVSEAMNHVARLRDYYRNDIRQSLQDLGAACVKYRTRIGKTWPYVTSKGNTTSESYENGDQSQQRDGQRARTCRTYRNKPR